jgi:threonine/homoserine/homoserine lactone efflux protein
MVLFVNTLVEISTLAIILKGLAIGLLAAAPTGPSGVLCIQRTLNKGRRFGFMTGLGISLSDAIYILCTSFGLSLVMDFIEDKQTFFIVKLIGCGLLLAFGIHTIRNNPFAKVKKTDGDKNSKLYYYLSGFLVSITNPLVIFIYLALFTYFSFPISEFTGLMKGIAYMSVVGGNVLWWFFISFLINKLKNRFDLRGIWIINRILGVVLIAASLIWFLYTIFTI